MTINNIDIHELIANAKEQMAQEEHLSPAFRATFEILLTVIGLLAARFGLNSKNSSTPPSADPNRKKKSRGKPGRKPGGQHGHKGSTLSPVDEPDHIETITVDQSTLPEGNYREAGYERRKVFDIDISRVVTEYRAQVLLDEKGRRFVAPFPEKVTRPAQYGDGVKTHVVYMSMHQLIPYNRIEEHFECQFGIPISQGSIFNFNREAYERLQDFEFWVREMLIRSGVLHVDETGINIGSDRQWLHTASSLEYTLFFPHQKRGQIAMDEMGVLPSFQGTLCHDHWKPYYTYGAHHALCNAHHLRELERAWEKDNQQWTPKMSELLKEINKATHDAGGALAPPEAEGFRVRYRKLLQEAEIECPPPEPPADGKKKRGRLARSKPRNLLERLRDFEQDVLRFMVDKDVPFSNNLAENDIRMTKVQQKISGCFRSMLGAKMFCRIRSYLSTSRKHGVSATVALTLLFQGKLPAFVNLDEVKKAECAE
jgi:transposase